MIGVKKIYVRHGRVQFGCVFDEDEEDVSGQGCK